MTPDEIEPLLLELCDAADAETLPRFRTAIAIDNKLAGGFDPVTEADQEAEAAIRRIIGEKLPDHGIEGEEHAPTNPDAEWQWIIDPVDGTRAFISGLPTWGTLIGLYHRGKPVAGALSQPYTGERFIASGNQPFVMHRGAKTGLATRDTATLGEAILMTTSPFLFNETGLPRYGAVEAKCRLTRYGFDCYAYAMLAAGHVDLVIESGLKAFDIAALIPLIEQAGGKVTTWNGSDASRGGDILACANTQIHEQAMELLA